MCRAQDKVVINLEYEKLSCHKTTRLRRGQIQLHLGLIKYPSCYWFYPCKTGILSRGWEAMSRSV